MRKLNVIVLLSGFAMLSGCATPPPPGLRPIVVKEQRPPPPADVMVPKEANFLSRWETLLENLGMLGSN